MKTKLLSFFLIFIILSCKEEETEPTKEIRRTTQTREAAGDGKWDLLGYGYNVTGEYASSASQALQVLNIDKLKVDYPTYVDESKSEGVSFSSAYGENAEEHSSELSKKVNATATYKTFKGSIDASFSFNDKWSAKYINSTYNLIIQKKRLRLTPYTDILRRYLQPAFVTDIQTRTPQELVAAYGTHILTDIILGGRLELHYQAETSSTNRKTAAAAGVTASFEQLFSTSTSTNYTQEDRKSNFNQRAYYKTVGGNSTSSIVKSIYFDKELPTASYDITGWQSGVTDENSELIDFGSNGLLPLYELIADPVRKEALRNYINQYLLDNQVKNIYEIGNIYRYYNAKDHDHFYTRAYSTYKAYSFEKVEFKALLARAPGSTPVHRYYKGNTVDHYYEISEFPRSVPGYIYEGIEFYAYKTRVPGTVPVYSHYHGKWENHFYTTDTGTYSGYVPEGIKFYTFSR